MLSELKKRKDKFHPITNLIDINGIEITNIDQLIELLGKDVVSEENWRKTVEYMRRKGIQAQLEFVPSPVSKDVLGKYTTSLAPEIQTITF